MIYRCHCPRPPPRVLRRRPLFGAAIVIIQDYLLYYNYWKTNLKDNTIVFQSAGKGGNVDYFG